MDLNDSTREAAFRAEAKAFLDAHAPNLFGEQDQQVADEAVLLERSCAWQTILYENGWAALTWPEQFGGRGLGPIEQIIWNQEIARAGIPESLFIVGTGLAGPTIIAHGREDQKERYLDRILRGEEVWCQLFSEPGAGSDLAGLATRAVRDGDQWVVSGQKTWCSGGHFSHWGILVARTDPSVPKHQGLTYFLVDMKTPGVEVRPLRQMTGGEHFNEVFLNEVRVPDTNRLGEVGQGWAVTMTTLMNERMAIGGLERLVSFDHLLALIKERKDRVDAVMRDRIAKQYSRMRALELLNARIVTKLGQGKIPATESSVMKLAIARNISDATEIAMDLLGPDALLGQGFWPHQYLQAPAIHIGGGTDEIQKNICAERVLGLPREENNDKKIPFQDLPRA